MADSGKIENRGVIVSGSRSLKLRTRRMKPQNFNCLHSTQTETITIAGEIHQRKGLRLGAVENMTSLVSCSMSVASYLVC